MKILFITNDAFDLVHSRKPFANFLNLQPEVECKLALLSNANQTGIITFSKTFRGVFRLLQFSIKNHFDVLIIRGVELSILTFPLIMVSLKVKRIIYITGLGRLWGENLTLNTYIFRNLYKLYLKILRVLGCSFWLQNNDDCQDLELQKACHVVHGSGVHVTSELPPKRKSKQVVYAGRVSYLKGFREMIRLAQTLPEDWRFLVCGEIDKSITNSDLCMFNSLVDSKKIIYRGFVSDMSEIFSLSSFAFYPSSYREGTPRFVLEGMSNGLVPIIPNKAGFKKIMVEGKVLDIEMSNWVNMMLEMDDLTYNKWTAVNYSMVRNIFSREVVYKEKLRLLCDC